MSLSPGDRLSQAEKYLDQQEFSKALSFYQTLHPDQFTEIRDLYRLGMLSFSLQQHEQACHCFVRVLQKGGASGTLYNNLGLSFFSRGCFKEAEACYRKSIELDPSSVLPHQNLGALYDSSGDWEHARTEYETVLQKDPSYELAILGLARLDEWNHDLVAAWARLLPLLSKKIPGPGACVLGAMILRQQGEFEKSLQLIEKVVEDPRERMHALFEKGQILDKLKRYQESFEVFVQAHKAHPSIRKEKEMYQEGMKELESIISGLRGKVTGLVDQVSSDSPIFIVGSPRSGTTLLEAMLGQYEELSSEGELDFFSRLLVKAARFLKRHVTLAEVLRELWIENNTGLTIFLRREYEALLQTLPGMKNGKRIIDKMPANARFIGVMAKIVPGAAVIHMLRDGREVALSAYMTPFAQEQWHSHDLADAAYEWKSTQKMIELSKDVFHVPYYLVRYETLVREAPQILPSLTKWLGLEWNEKCLEFHQSTKIFRTASYAQVNRPLYTSSLERSRRYPEAHALLNHFLREDLIHWGYDSSSSRG